MDLKDIEKREQQIKEISERIKSEYHKHSSLEWTYIAAKKIFYSYLNNEAKCPFCAEEMQGFELTHYKCKKCNQYFTNRIMELAELYNLAKMYPDFDQFKQHIKVKFTGEPITQEIDCELMLIRVNCTKDKYINTDTIKIN